MMPKLCQVVLVIFFILVNIGSSFGAATVSLDPPWDKVKELALTKGRLDATSGCYAYSIQAPGIEAALTFCPSDGSVGIFRRDVDRAMGIGVGSVNGKRWNVLLDLRSNATTLIEDGMADKIAFDIFRLLVSKGLL